MRHLIEISEVARVAELQVSRFHARDRKNTARKPNREGKMCVDHALAEGGLWRVATAIVFASAAFVLVPAVALAQAPKPFFTKDGANYYGKGVSKDGGHTYHFDGKKTVINVSGYKKAHGTRT
jgi:hypothetical protein